MVNIGQFEGQMRDRIRRQQDYARKVQSLERELKKLDGESLDGTEQNRYERTRQELKAAQGQLAQYMQEEVHLLQTEEQTLMGEIQKLQAARAAA